MPQEPREIYQDQWIPSACSMCYNGCSIKGHVVNNTLIKIEGNPESNMGWGRLCPKGVSGIMTLYDPHRLNVPLLRTNPKKGKGVPPCWKEISWEEAMEILCDKLKEVYETDPRALFFQSTTTVNTVKHGLPESFIHAFGSPNLTAAGGGLHCGNSAHLINGLFHASWSLVPDFEFCDYALYFGCSKGHSAGHGANVNAQLAAAARDRGMKLVAVDPVNNFAASKSVEWVPIIPGTDGALALAMINVMVNELGVYDEEYLKLKTNAPYLIGPDGRYVRDPETHKPLVWDPDSGRALPFDDSGIKDFALAGAYEVGGQRAQPAFALLKEHVRSYSPEFAQKVTGVPAATVRRLAREFSEAARIGSTIRLDGRSLAYRPAAAVYFRGTQGHKNGFHTCVAIELLNQICGTADRVGGALGFNPVCHGHPETGKPYYTPTADEDGLMITGAWVVKHKPYPFRRASEPVESMAMRELFPLAMISGIPFSKDQELLWEKVGLPYRPQLMLNFGANSLMSVGNSDTVAETLMRIPYVIAFEIYLNEFTDFADLVLPDTCYLERLDVNANHPLIFSHPAGRGSWTWSIRQPVVAPVGQRRDIQEVLLEVARRIGILPQLNAQLNLVFDLTGPYKLDLNQGYSWEEICDRRLKSLFGDHRGLDWFREHGVLNWPKKVDEVYWRDLVPVRVPIYLEFMKDIRAQAEPLARKYSIDVDWDAYYNPLVSYLPVSVHQSDHQYDLYGFYYRHPLHTNAFTMENPWLDEVSQRTPGTYEVIINTRTGQQKGIRDGDWIMLESAHGRKVKARAILREGIHPKCVAVAGNCGHWADGMPVAKGKGVFFNDLLEIDFEHLDPVTHSLELTVKLKIAKTSPPDTSNRGLSPQRVLEGMTGD